jgi:hypothetical protein
VRHREIELKCQGGSQIRRRLAAPGVVFLLMAVACAAEGQEATDAKVPSPTAASEPSPTSAVQDVMPIEYFAPLEPATYSIDPDVDASTPLRVEYEIPAEGWERWIGAGKFSDAGHVAVSITTVSNLVTNGCQDHSWAEPPVGPSVEDLATALAGLAPFRVSSPPEDVDAYGYSGMHLELTVPRRPDWHDGRFIGCEEWSLKSWVAAIDTEPGDAYYGYTGPDYTEEIWILDVVGTRLMIAAEQSPGSPPRDLAELRVILDSIQIEP